jgi:hypothetical protein
VAVGEDRAGAPRAPTADPVLDVLAASLQIALEAAIFPDRFEIDEQEPRSRLEALTEQLLHRARALPSNGITGAEEAASKATTISIIAEVSKRIRAAIQ